MNDPRLSGCWAKLNRANVHVDALHMEVAAFDSEANGPVIELHFDPDLNVFTGIITSEIVFPAIFGVTIGDALHNLRSALDHLAWQLALLTTSKPSRRTQFPIVTGPDYWCSERVQAMLHHIRPRDRALIETYQPFMENGGISAQDDILALLNRLSNEDKHRIIHPVGAKSAEATVSITDGPYDCRVIDMNVLAAGSLLHVNAKLVTLTIERTGPRPRVKVVPDIPLYIAFEDGRSIEETLALMGAYVSDMLTEFETRSFT